MLSQRAMPGQKREDVHCAFAPAITKAITADT